MSTLSRRSLLTGSAAFGAALALRDVAGAQSDAPPQWPFDIYDVHTHVSQIWFQPVESLIPELNRAGVQHSVLCQFFGQYDNEYEFEVARRYPGKFGIIVHVDATKPDAVAKLKAYADRGASGVRLDPAVRTAGPDPLAVWKAADEYGMSISVFGGTVASLITDDFARVIQTIPQTPLVLEHQAGDYNNFASADDVKKAFALSRFPNTYVMIGGLGEFSRRAAPVTRPLPFAMPIPPVLDMAYDAFGAHRMLWGSDFPASAPREGYYHSLTWTMDYLKNKSLDDRAWIFGKTARQLFPIKPVAG
jgi:L-fuconolactonase